MSVKSMDDVLYLSTLHLIALPFFFFFNDTATTEIYTLSLHDALPIFRRSHPARMFRSGASFLRCGSCERRDRKSTRLNSSHVRISYAVFCLKKKKKITTYVRLSKGEPEVRLGNPIAPLRFLEFD